MSSKEISPEMMAHRQYGEDIGRDQANLGYNYESALGRMAAHPDYAEKCANIIQGHPYVTSEKEATDIAEDMKNKGLYCCQVWAKIGKDEEYYYIKDNYFIVTEDSKVIQAAEYIGMALLYSFC